MPALLVALPAGYPASGPVRWRIEGTPREGEAMADDEMVLPADPALIAAAKQLRTAVAGDTEKSLASLASAWRGVAVRILM